MQVSANTAIVNTFKFIKVETNNQMDVSLTLFRLGFLRVAQLGWGGGGGGRKVPAAYNSKTINDNGMKFSGVVKDQLVKRFNWRVTS